MMRMSGFGFVLAAAVLLGTPGAFAGTLLEEDFDGLPHGTVLFNQLPGLNQSGTEGFADPPTGSTMTGATNAPVNGFGGGSAALFFNDTLTTGNQLLLVSDGTVDVDPAQTNTVSFDYFYDASVIGGNPLQNMNLFMDDGVGQPIDGLNLQLYSTFRQVRLNGTTPLPVAGGGTQLKTNTWYRYVVTIHPLDAGTDTYDLQVIEDTGGAGTVVIATNGLPFAADIADITRYQWQGFTSGAATHQAYFDNIRITFPDPPPAPEGPKTVLVDVDFETALLNESMVDYGAEEKPDGQILWSSQLTGTGLTSNDKYHNWTSNSPPYQRITATTNAPVNGFVTQLFTPEPANEVAIYLDDQMTGEGDMALSLDIPDSFTLDPGNTNTLSFDYLSVAQGNSAIRLFASDASGVANGLDLTLFDASGQVKNGGEVLGTLASNTWHRYDLTIYPTDTGTNTFDLQVKEDTGGGGTEVLNATNLTFTGGTVAGITQVKWQTFANLAATGMVAYLDTIRVGVQDQQARAVEPGRVMWSGTQPQLNTTGFKVVDTGEGLQLMNVALRSDTPSAGFTGATNVLRYLDSTTTVGGSPRLQVDMDTVALDPDEIVVLSFDYYNVSNGNQNARLFMTDDEGGLTTGLDLTFFTTTDQVKNGSSTLAVHDGGNNWLQANTWYRYELTIDVAADTYDLLITKDTGGDGTVVLDETGLAFSGGTVTNFTRVELMNPFTGSGGVGHLAYFDNIRICIPGGGLPIRDVSVAGGMTMLTYDSVVGLPSHLESTPSLLDPVVWALVPGSTTNATGTNVTYGVPAGPDRVLFYQAVSP